MTTTLSIAERERILEMARARLERGGSELELVTINDLADARSCLR